MFEEHRNFLERSSQKKENNSDTTLEKEKKKMFSFYEEFMEEIKKEKLDKFENLQMKYFKKLFYSKKLKPIESNKLDIFFKKCLNESI